MRNVYRQFFSRSVLVLALISSGSALAGVPTPITPNDPVVEPTIIEGQEFPPTKVIEAPPLPEVKPEPPPLAATIEPPPVVSNMMPLPPEKPEIIPEKTEPEPTPDRWTPVPPLDRGGSFAIYPNAGVYETAVYPTGSTRRDQCFTPPASEESLDPLNYWSLKDLWGLSVASAPYPFPADKSLNVYWTSYHCDNEAAKGDLTQCGNRGVVEQNIRSQSPDTFTPTKEFSCLSKDGTPFREVAIASIQQFDPEQQPIRDGKNQSGWNLLSATYVYDGACGTADIKNGGKTVTEAPTENLCHVGANTPPQLDPSVSNWTWICQGGDGGGSSANCSTAITAACGMSDTHNGGLPTVNAPTEFLCAPGMNSTPKLDETGNNWLWVCQTGQHYSSPITCSVPHSVVATCGAASGAYVNGKPITDLCLTGTPSSLTGNDPWEWTCSASDQVACATACSPLPGRCGHDNGTCSLGDPGPIEIKNTRPVTPTPCSRSGGPCMPKVEHFAIWQCSGRCGGGMTNCSALLP